MLKLPIPFREYDSKVLQALAFHTYKEHEVTLYLKFFN
jgi:hypothetical protein